MKTTQQSAPRSALRYPRKSPERPESPSFDPPPPSAARQCPGLPSDAPAWGFQKEGRESISLHVSREAELESVTRDQRFKLTPTEDRELGQLARNIGRPQFLRLLVKKALHEAKNGGFQIMLDLKAKGDTK